MTEMAGTCSELSPGNLLVKLQICFLEITSTGFMVLKIYYSELQDVHLLVITLNAIFFSVHTMAYLTRYHSTGFQLGPSVNDC